MKIAVLAAIGAVFLIAALLKSPHFSALDAQPVTVRSQLDGKTTEEKADIKADAISKKAVAGTFVQDGLTIEVDSVTKINGGVEIYARAWDGSTQLGFGVDGTTDLERFLIYNPPILVPDPNGDIVVDYIDDNTKEAKQRILREDPLEAIKQTLAHTMRVSGKTDTKIVSGSVGHTTATFYPEADPASVADDGRCKYSAAQQSWAGIIGQTTASDCATNPSEAANPTNAAYTFSGTSSNNWEDLMRGFFLFNTSSIGSGATVSSGTFSLYGNTKNNAGTQSIALVSSSPSSNTDLVTSDFDNVGSTEFATALTIAGWSNAGYNDFTLNASGLAAVSVTGVTKFATRLSGDLSGSQPTWGSHQETYVTVYYADTTGTTQDPSLVVTYSAAGGSTPAPDDGFMTFQ